MKRKSGRYEFNSGIYFEMAPHSPIIVVVVVVLIMLDCQSASSLKKIGPFH